MRLSCPSCQTEYDVPDAALMGRTRKLRCVNCGYQWEAGPLGGPGPEPDTGPAPTEAELEFLRRPRTALANGMTYGAAEPTERQEFEQEFGQDYAPPATVSRALELPKRVDPAEARHQADRESFAALLEASRQPGNQTLDTSTKKANKKANKAGRKGANPWLVSLLILLLAAGMIYLEREHIMAAWPPSIRFFAALGLK